MESTKLNGEFPDIVSKRITGIGYHRNRIDLQLGDVCISFSADKKGNLTINGLKKQFYRNINDK